MPRNPTLREYVDPFDERDLHLWTKLEHLGRYQYAADVLRGQPAGIHLDLGCATAYGLCELAGVTRRAIGVDYDAALLEEAAGRVDAGHVELVLADLDVTPIAEILAPVLGVSLIDSVTAFEIFEHLDRADETLRGLGTCMREGALMLASVPNARFEPSLAASSHHHRTYQSSQIRPSQPADPGNSETRYEFAELLEAAGFSVEQVIGQGTVNRVNQRETRLVRRGWFDLRPSDEAVLHTSQNIHKLARLLAYPDDHDLEDSYSHIFIARWRGGLVHPSGPPAETA